MKKIGVLLLMCMLVGVGFAQERLLSVSQVAQPGESLVYKISFMFLTVGEARIETSPAMHTLNNKACYKVDITGRTTGAVGWVAKVDDKWGSFLDAKSLLPIKNYRIVRENNYKRDEVTYFDFNQKNIKYHRFDYDAGKFKDAQIFAFKETVRDLIGGYYYLRQIDYSQLNPGDTIRLYGFFEDEFYDFDILYKGKEKISTQFGKVSALKLVPIMPDNKIFDGENSISLWLSDDANRIPLKAEANMFIGKAACDIIAYDNLRSTFAASKGKK